MRIKDLVPRKWFESGLVRRDERDPFTTLHEKMNSLFDNFARSFDRDWGFGSLPILRDTGSFSGISPRIDVSETDKEYQVTAELPGMEEKDVDLLISDDRLTIKGEKKFDKEEKEKDFYRRERGYGSFCRTMPIPYGAETDKANAVFKDGVLSITIPKSKEAETKTKKIEIKKG